MRKLLRHSKVLLYISLIFVGTIVGCLVVSFLSVTIHDRLERNDLRKIINSTKYEYNYEQYMNIRVTTIKTEEYKLSLREISNIEYENKSDTNFSLVSRDGKVILYKSIHDNPKLIPLISEIKRKCKK